MKLDEKIKIYLEKKTKKESRISWIITAAIIGILVNIVLAIMKLVVGKLSNSIAIISDAVNNISDALSSVVTIIGIFFSSKIPNKKHPYGYGRVEYISSLIISFLLILVGIEFIKSSINIIKNPKEINFSLISLIMLFIAVFGKIFLGYYNKKIAKETKSPALMASSKDAYADVLITSLTIISTILSLFTNFVIDGYVGIFISIVIIVSGISLISDTLDSIIGKSIDKDLANELYEFVNSSENVQGSYDLILNNYGPEKYIGSINVSFLDTMSLRDVSVELVKLQNKVYEKYGIYLVFGVYSKNTEDKKVLKDEKIISDIVSSYKEVESMHAFYIIYDENLIRMDIMVDFDVLDVEDLVNEIKKEILKKYPNYNIVIGVDHSCV